MFEKQVKYYLLIKRKTLKSSEDMVWMPYSDMNGIIYFNSLNKVEEIIKILLRIEVYPPYKLENIKLRKLTEEEIKIKI